MNLPGKAAQEKYFRLLENEHENFNDIYML